jgi:predicted esterase
MSRRPPIVLTALLAALAMTWLAAPARAADTEGEARQLMAQLKDQFDRKAYAEAEKTCKRLCEILPRNAACQYNHACALARLGRKDDAFAALDRAAQAGYGDADHMQADEDLASLRGDPRYAAVVDKVKRNDDAGGGAAYEPGAEIAGVKTVENQPAGGLRYRVRMSPDATPEKPNRLVIWLHPSGGSMNRNVESMAPQLVRRGFALMVFTQKQFMGWNGAEIHKLSGKTLDDAAKIPGLDARRPILMGYSAGGQAAIILWQSKPELLGGLLLCAAYPVARGPSGVSVLDPPKSDAVKTCPFFALVGTQDNGSRAWQRAEESWRDAGVPLTVRYVEGKGHTYLFGGKVMTDVYAWLEAIGAGKTPVLPSERKVEPPPAEPGQPPGGEGKKRTFF